MTFNIDHTKLDLPLHPGDTVFSVCEEDGKYSIFEVTVSSVIISHDNTMQFIIDTFVEEFGPKYQVFPTKEEAEQFISQLQASIPRHIKPDLLRDWYCPRIWLPHTSMEVILTLTKPPENEPDHSIFAFFVREGESKLSEGFYIVSPSAFDKNFNIHVDLLNAENTMRIPDDCIYAWEKMGFVASYVNDSLPLKIENHE